MASLTVAFSRQYKDIPNGPFYVLLNAQLDLSLIYPTGMHQELTV